MDRREPRDWRRTSKAEEAMNSLVTSMSLEELRSPSVKGYSE